MQNLRTSRLLIVATVLAFCAFFNKANAQTHTPQYISTGPNSNGFWEYLPQGYNPSSSQTYPLIVFIHGIGELGAGNAIDLPRMLNAGVPQAINAGNFPVSVTVNGQTHKFIVISPQFINWPGGGDIDMVINYAVSHYKVNLNRVYLTGLSMGGGVAWEYAGAGSPFIDRIAALAPICGASWPDIGRSRNIANGNLPVWAFHNDGDPTVPVWYTNDYISQINQAPAPNPLARKTIFPYTGHDCWTTVYNGYSENGMTVYQWMLQYQKGVTPPAYFNQAPTVNAGPDQIVAPGANVQLSGTATDTDGTIASYAWSQVSGPNTATFSNPAIPNPVLSNLIGGVYVFRLTATDNGGTANTDDVKITVPATLPTKIEAENYSAMYGIQTENTIDVGGGLNVGWQEAGDWMEYDINVTTTGTYNVNYRVASVVAGAQFQLRKADGTVLSTVNVPVTGNVQTWTTVSAPATFSTTGVQKIRIYTTASPSGWNFNWMDFTGNGGGQNQSPVVNAGADQTITLPVSSVTLNGSATDADGSISTYAWSKVSGPSAGTISSPSSASTQVTGLVEGSYTFRLTATDNSGATGYDDVIVTVNSAAIQLPPSSSVKIEAENYTSMSGIGTENTSDVGGGLNVGWQDNNDWMNYSVNLSAAGTYTVNFRVASYFTGAQFQLRKADGTVLTTVTVPNTGSFQTWQTVSAQVTLPAGQQTLRIFTSAANGGWNINWWEIAGASSSSTPPPASSTKIEAEGYTAMSGIGTENTSDAGGGLNVGWQDNNDWMDYSVNLAAAGTYTVNFRVASSFSGATFQLRKSDGTVLATVTVPNTGSFQTWQTVSAQATLPAGQQTLRIVTTAANGGWNINWWEIAGASSSTPPPASSTKIEAESYSAMSGIGTENTSDTGGGLNVGWQDNNDWMDYVVNASAAGTYTVNFRVASAFTGATFQLRKSDGTVLTTVTVPNTGSFQKWTTISSTVTLPAGQQTLRIVTTAANGGWNINWWEIVSGVAARGTEAAGTVEQVITKTTSAEALQVFPNPIADKFMLKVNTAQTGKMKVEIFDMKGALVKQFSVNKAATGISQSYLSIGDLQTGQYILKATMNNYSETKQLIKK